ncbi:uncharacterized protein LOC126977173 isoform X2 [Leptidea sinapis]|uniref:uncharacterized protein LOC126977173 isoform X2 n=1 Tax=Leptidea sinapis TaxID=189913 RepID=UPI0021C3B52B|nr:uncharacterized protein LOC126977173 isoform X2 [Leptidea sinapis]
MDLNTHQNQSYWFVVREDQSNVIFSSNNFTIQNPPTQETRFIVDTSENRQYLQVCGLQTIPEEPNKDTCAAVESKEDVKFWDRNKIKILLNLCLDNRYMSENSTMIWDEVALLVGTTPELCEQKFRNLRRTYIRLMKKKQMGKEIKWIHYNLCEKIFKDLDTTVESIEPWEDAKVRRLLTLYLENICKFRDTNYSQKDTWREIAAQLNTSEHNCYHKFKNLKRTYFNCLEKSRDTGKIIKWRYHNYFERIYYNYTPDMGPWDKHKILQLIKSYAEIAHKFRDPKYQKKELWREISRKVGESPSHCDRKFRNLKQTFVRLKMREDAGKSITKWRYYKDFLSIYENKSYSLLIDDIDVVYKNQEQDYIMQLLNFYIENKDKFNDPLVKKKNLWRIIGAKVGLTPVECDKKFRNMKQTYMRLVKKQQTGDKPNSWPYYPYFEQIYGEHIPKKEHAHINSCNIDMNVEGIRSIIREAHEIKEQDKFNRLVKAIEESNNIQRERNKILQALLDR